MISLCLQYGLLGLEPTPGPNFMSMALLEMFTLKKNIDLLNTCFTCYKKTA